MVIALTHQWTKNDVAFAQEVPGIDMVLGGHDHSADVQAIQNPNDPTKDIPMIKSGSEFHDLGIIDISFGVDVEKMNAAKTSASESTQI